MFIRKSILSGLFALTAATASAQLDGDGYYRVQNYMSERYVYVTDDKGKVNVSTTSADLYAIKLWKDLDKAIPDPASVIKIRNVGSQYNLESQGTSLYDIIGFYVNIRSSSNGSYLAYATYNGAAEYIGDLEQSDSPDGVLSDVCTGLWRNWYIKPIKSDSENYFGVRPDFQANGKYYALFYAEFPFSFVSGGMKAYIVSKVGAGMAALREITTGIIPGATPVIIECASADPSGNRLELHNVDAAALSGNMLRGVYFDNPAKNHYNRLPNDPATMRVLTALADGSLAFVKAETDFMPANKSYLSVPAGTPDVLAAVSEADFTNGISEIPAACGSQAAGVYTLSGTRLRESGVTDGLPAGIYIVGGKKVVVR